MLTDDEEDGKNEIKTNKTETKDQYIEQDATRCVDR